MKITVRTIIDIDNGPAEFPTRLDYQHEANSGDNPRYWAEEIRKAVTAASARVLRSQALQSPLGLEPTVPPAAPTGLGIPPESVTIHFDPLASNNPMVQQYLNAQRRGLLPGAGA